MSDRFRRKPFVTVGYTISALSKPLMGMAATARGWPLFLLRRSTDRLGKSIRTLARVALIVDSAETEHRGLAFGLHPVMDRRRGLGDYGRSRLTCAGAQSGSTGTCRLPP